MAAAQQVQEGGLAAQGGADDVPVNRGVGGGGQGEVQVPEEGRVRVHRVGVGVVPVEGAAGDVQHRRRRPAVDRSGCGGGGCCGRWSHDNSNMPIGGRGGKISLVHDGFIATNLIKI